VPWTATGLLLAISVARVSAWFASALYPLPFVLVMGLWVDGMLSGDGRGGESEMGCWK
jgi:hypothetical protein